jgi:hypothetical protein
MNQRNRIFSPFLRPTRRVLALFLSILFCLFFASCKRNLDWTEYVSEYRNNLFLYVGENFSVRAQNVQKEYPYVADGYKGEMTQRIELFITAPQGTEHCSVRFTVDGHQHEGETSYDNVKRHFYYSCTANAESVYTLPVELCFDGVSQEVTLTSVKSDGLLSLQEVLTHAFAGEQELLKKLTPNHEFEGELYVRLLYEDAPFFYVGIVERQGKVTSLLLDGETGKTLAKRTA